MGPDGPREQIADALARLGCEITEYADGTYCVDCPSHLAKVRALDLLAWRDARYDPRVRHTAAAIAQGAKTNAQHKVDPLDLAGRLHSYVTHRVRYLGEGPEIFQSSSRTLQTGMGDCDDSTRCLLALARSVAVPARLVVFDRSPPGGELEPNHATVQLSGDGKAWYYAETSLGPGVAFGEHPIRAARRLKSERGELGRGDLGAPSPSRDATMRAVIVQAWQNALARDPTPFEGQLTGAIALAETGAGVWDGDCMGSHNWGAIMCKPGSVAGPDCCKHLDHNQDGTPFDALFRVYPDDVTGATDLVREITTRRPLTRAALAAGRDVYSVIAAMYRERYYGAGCPNAIKLYGSSATKDSSWGNAQHQPTSAAGEACDKEAIMMYATRVHTLAARLANEAGEPEPPLGSPPWSRWTWGAIAVGVAGAGYLVAAHEKKLPRSWPTPF